MEEYIRQYYHAPLDANSPIYITWAGHRVCTPTHEIGPRILDNYKLSFVVKGSGFLQQGDQPVKKLSAGDMFMLFPKIRHYYYTDADDPWELMWVCFNGRLCHDICESLNIDDLNYVVLNAFNNSIDKTMNSILRGMADVEDPDKYRAIGYLYILFAQLRTVIRSNRELVEETAREDIVEKAIAFIEQNYYLHIDVDILCSHVNYSRSYLSRIFKSETGMSIPGYITKVRIQYAKLLLRDTDLPVNEVGISVGITDPYYFSKIFKKGTGISPALYRKQLSDTNLSVSHYNNFS